MTWKTEWICNELVLMLGDNFILENVLVNAPKNSSPQKSISLLILLVWSRPYRHQAAKPSDLG